MHTKSKSSGAMTIPAGIGLALLVSLVITAAGAAVAAALVACEKIGEGAVAYAAMLILAIATLIGAWAAVRFIKRLRLQMAMVFGGCCYLLLLSITALFFGGQYQGMGMTALIILLASSAVAFLPAAKAKTWKKKKTLYR